MKEKQQIEEIKIVQMSDFSEEIQSSVKRKAKEQGIDFEGFVKVTMVTAPTIQVHSVEPIGGTDMDWIINIHERTCIDYSTIF